MTQDGTIARLRKVLRDAFIETDVTVHDQFNTVPNWITIAGFPLIAGYVYLYTSEIYLWMIFPVLFLIFLGDLLDGHFARTLNQHSRIGKIIDPVRDRLAGGAILGHMLYVSFSGLTILLAISIVLFELYIGWINRGGIRQTAGGRVHTIGKARQAVHGLCAMAFGLAQYPPYLNNSLVPEWIAGLDLSPPMMLTIMLLATVIATIAYQKTPP